MHVDLHGCFMNALNFTRKEKGKTTQSMVFTTSTYLEKNNPPRKWMDASGCKRKMDLWRTIVKWTRPRTWKLHMDSLNRQEKNMSNQ